jgi:TRAP transporter TAXI family solute receptor
LDALSLGTSSVGSAFYTLAVGMADLLGRETGISLTAEPVGGSDANLRALKARKVDLAVINADSAAAAFNGVEQFSADGKVPIRLMAQGQLSLRQIVARRDAGIDTPADLAGKRFVMRRKALREMETLGRALLAAYGLREQDVTVLETAETNDAIEALKIGSADAAIVPGGVPASFLSDLTEASDVRFLSLPDDKLAEILTALGPAFRKGIVPAGTYRGQDADVAAPAVAAVLVARADIPADSVYALTKAVFEHPERLRTIHSAGRDWTVQNTLTAPPVPFHPGAARYFKEIGAWREDLLEHP